MNDVINRPWVYTETVYLLIGWFIISPIAIVLILKSFFLHAMPWKVPVIWWIFWNYLLILFILKFLQRDLEITMEPGTWNKKRPFMDFWQEEVARRLVGLREMEAEEMRKIWRLQVMFIFDVWNDGMFIYGALCCPYLFNNCYSYRAAARAVPATQNTK